MGREGGGGGGAGGGTKTAPFSPVSSNATFQRRRKLGMKSNIGTPTGPGGSQLLELACQRASLPKLLLARGQVFQSYFLPEAKFPSSLLFDVKSSKRACQPRRPEPRCQANLPEAKRRAPTRRLELLTGRAHVSANEISEGAAKFKWIFTSHHTALHTSSWTVCNRSLHCLVCRLARTPPHQRRKGHIPNQALSLQVGHIVPRISVPPSTTVEDHVASGQR